MLGAELLITLLTRCLFVCLFVYRPEGDVSHGAGQPDVEVQDSRRAPEDHVLQGQGEEERLLQLLVNNIMRLLMILNDH